jgi:hypothetical protein
MSKIKGEEKEKKEEELKACRRIVNESDTASYGHLTESSTQPIYIFTACRE